MDKLIKIGFSVFSFVAVVFGFVRIANNLHLSFNQEATSQAVASEQLLDETKQRITDTDVDGLSDWEELNTYGTSPYLKDSDSDGISDAEEIKAGTDPNCPSGKLCGTSNLAPAGEPPASVPNTNSGDSSSTEPTAEDINNLTPDEIRALLKQGGVTDEQLQGASDDDLRQLLNEAIKEQQ